MQVHDGQLRNQQSKILFAGTQYKLEQGNTNYDDIIGKLTQ